MAGLGRGLEMSSLQAGLITSVIGVVGIPLQIFFYPRIQGRLGTIRAYKMFSILFPLSYALIPWVSLTSREKNTIHWSTWLFLTAILVVHTIGRVVSGPATISLLNAATPMPSVRGATNGVGQAISGIFRTLGPIVAAYSFAYGAEVRSGICWWVLSVVSSIGSFLIWWMSRSAVFCSEDEK